MVKLNSSKLRLLKAGISVMVLMLSFLWLLGTNTFAVNFTYNKDNHVQTYNIPTTGKYKLEVWGAQGGYSWGDYDGDGNAKPGGAKMADGGKGGYAVGEINLKQGDTLYIVIGAHGGNAGKKGTGGAGGYNGGGSGKGDGGGDEDAPDACGGGGGATHIALNSNRGVLKNYKDNKNEILIVAGGGGGAAWNNTGGTGGGTKGGKKGSNEPGTQNSGYAFGQGQNGTGNVNDIGSAGGGGGWYGGHAATNGNGTATAAGGSGHLGSGVSGSMQNGIREGNGYARITLIDTAISVPTKTNHTYDSLMKIGVNEGTGYTLTGTNQAINAGTYTVVAKLKTGYIWSDGTHDDKTITWEINKRTLNVSIQDYEKEYLDADPMLIYTFSNNVTGEIPAFNMPYLSRIAGEDIGDYIITGFDELELENNTNFVASNYKIATDNTVRYLTISPRSISQAEVEYVPSSFIYDGEEKEPKTIVKIAINGQMHTLERDKDYTVIFRNNLNRGNANVTIKGRGNYKDSINSSFLIEPADITPSDVRLNPTEYVFDGSSRTPGTPREPGTIVVLNGKELVRDIDYEVIYVDNSIQTDNAKAIVSGINNYYGQITKEFKIAKRLIDAEIILDKDSIEYNGQERMPHVIKVIQKDGIVLTDGEDFEVFYEDNIEVGNAKVKLVGIGAFYGECIKYFEIFRETPSVFLKNKTSLYTGSPIRIDRAQIEGILDYENYYDSLIYKYYYDYQLEEEVGGPPTEVGIYYVQATLPESSNYTEAKSGVAKLIIVSKPDAPIIKGNDGQKEIKNLGRTKNNLYVNIYGSISMITPEVDVGYLYSLDGNTWNKYSKTLEFTEDSKITIYAKSYLVNDPAQESNVTTYVAYIDRTPININDIEINMPEEVPSVIVEISVNGDEAEEILISEDPSINLESGDWKNIGAKDLDDKEAGKTVFELSQGDEEKTVYIWVKDFAGNVSGPIQKKITLNAIMIGNQNINDTLMTFKVFDKYLYSHTIEEGDIELYVNDVKSYGTAELVEESGSDTTYYYKLRIKNVNGDGKLDFKVISNNIIDKAGNAALDINKLIPTNEITVDNTLPKLEVEIQGNMAMVHAEDIHMKAIMQNGHIIGRLDGDYLVKLVGGINKFEVIDLYGNEVIKEVEYNIDYTSLKSIPNSPDMLDGMQSVYYVGGVEHKENYFTKAMYSYDWQNKDNENTTSKWANAIIHDSYFVWIPKYAYKIIYYEDAEHTIESDEQTNYKDVEVIFMKEYSDTEYEDENGDLHPLPDGYTINPIFYNNIEEGGWENKLRGIWVSKYEMSREDLDEAKYLEDAYLGMIPDSIKANIKVRGNRVIGATSTKGLKDKYFKETQVLMGGADTLLPENGNTEEVLRMVSKEDRHPWNGISVNVAYDNSLTFDKYNNSHLMRNNEYEAILLLAQSEYGRNGDYIALDNTLKTGGDLSTSTTGNITGVFDLIGGSWEYEAGYIDTNSLEYGESLIEEDREHFKEVFDEEDLDKINYLNIEKQIFEQSLLENPYLNSKVIYRGGYYKSELLNDESIPVQGSADERFGFRVVLIK